MNPHQLPATVQIQIIIQTCILSNGNPTFVARLSAGLLKNAKSHTWLVFDSWQRDSVPTDSSAQFRAFLPGKQGK